MKKSKAITAYRFFDRAVNGSLKSRYGSVTWPAPTSRPGKWVRHHGPLALCASGLHASPTILASLQNAQGTVLGRVEARGIGPADPGKFCAREMRVVQVWGDRHLRAIACAAAISALPIYERSVPGDRRVRACIEAIVGWLRTGAQPKNLAAARAAARDAARARARAWAAAWDAARSAAGAASGDSAWNADFDLTALRLLSLPEDALARELEKLLGRKS